jgi:ribose transport system substrate-binding protein
MRWQGVLRAAAAGALALLLGAVAAEDAAAELSLEGLELAKPDAEQAEALEQVPEAVRQYYVGYWLFSAIHPNPYADWTPPSPPWQFCYNDSYQGNSWRQAALQEYQRLVGQLAGQGLARPELIVSNSNNDINVQLAQLTNMVRQGCNVIVSIPSSPTGLCAGIKDARSKGVLLVTAESPAECPEAVNVDFNEYYAAAKTAKWLADAMGGKGNLVMENGIPGLGPTVARRQAVLDVLQHYPNIKVLGEFDGNWTPSVAKTKMLQFLATHPQPIQGVWNGALMGVAAGQAFEQVGRPLPKINGFSGSCSFLAYWKEKRLESFGGSQSGSTALYTAVDVAYRMLKGQKPAVNTILTPLPEVTQANFGDWYKPSMTVQDSCFADPPDGRRVSEDDLGRYFTNGATPSPALQP